MHIYIGAVLLIVVIILSILLICGLPLGELTMGGRYKVWPVKMRGLAVSQLLVQGFALYILLAAGKICPIFISDKATKVACICFAVFFFGNTVMNFFSPSKKEKCIMMPMSLVEAICFTVTAINL